MLKSVLIKRIVFIILTIVLVISSAFIGYSLTKRYKGTITNAYNNFLDGISEKIDNFQNEILTETSEI